MHDGPVQGLHIHRCIDSILEFFDINFCIVLGLAVITDHRTMLALNQDADRITRHLDELADLCDRADLIQVVQCRSIHFRINLRRQHDFPVFDHRLLQCSHRALTPDIEMYHHIREHHHAA